MNLKDESEMAVKRKPTAAEKPDARDSGGIRLDLEHRSFYRLSLLATKINRAIANAYVKNIGRPANAWKVVTVLGGFGAMSASQIHSHTTLEMDKVTRIVDSLVEQGIATREQDKTDRRRVTVALSAKGKKVNSQLEEMIVAMEYEFMVILNRGERDALYDFLDRLQSRADQVFGGKRRWGSFS
jgi:DNA-binding MarR family transcriptional regulator